MDRDLSGIEELRRLAEKIRRLLDDQLDPDQESLASKELGELGSFLQELAVRYQKVSQQLELHSRIDLRINSGVLLDDILEAVYRDLRQVIPFNRIGVALIEQDSETVRSRWAKSDLGRIKIAAGYSSPLKGSSLEQIIDSGKPRVLNDLREYLKKNPQSSSTRLIVEEGICSSLTCPLIVNDKPVGFIFFSSCDPNTYQDAHVELFQRIAAQLSVIVEKGRLMSEAVARQEEMERINRKLESLNELKNSFVGMAAHDIRGPINIIKTICDTFIDSREILGEDQERRFLEIARRKCEYMLALIDKLLDVTLIESGKLNLQSEEIDIQSFLGEAADDYGKLALRKGIGVLMKAVDSGTLRADPMRIRQVVDNLLSNAIKYSPPGSEVEVSASRTEEGWEISVVDQGPGLSPDDLRHIFQDFKKLSARPTGGEQSSGLGLAISRRIVEAHGGRIGVAAAPGGGSRFWFVLPCSSGL